MKRIICILAAVALMALAAVGLTLRPPETVLLVIEQTDWAGEKDFVPTGQTKTCEVKTGDVISCGGCLDLEVRVLIMSSESVMIETSAPMSSREAPYVDLLSEQTHFLVRKDKPLRLATPTMDAGDIFIFSILQQTA